MSELELESQIIYTNIFLSSDITIQYAITLSRVFVTNAVVQVWSEYASVRIWIMGKFGIQMVQNGLDLKKSSFLIPFENQTFENQANVLV